MPQYDTEQTIFFQGWIKKAKLIMCSDPLLEGPANHVLTRMLALVPYQMLAKGGKAERTKDTSVAQGPGTSNEVPKQSGLQPDTNKRIPSKGGRTPSAASRDPEAPGILMNMM